MPAAFLPLDIDAGEDWTLALQICDDDDTPQDITGWTGRMQIRDETNSPTAIATISTAGGGMTLDGPNGFIYLKFNNTQTMAMASDNVNHVRVHDIELSDLSGDIVPLFYGPANVRANVTR